VGGCESSTVELFNWRHMAIVTVKNKYQVVIPKSVRDKIGLNVGDILEAKVERGKITFKPKSLLDRGIDLSLEDYRKGRFYGPFDTHEELIASLHAELRKLRAKKSARPAA
jgi:AbrB family looped-hinge helix DNA binding protein